MTAAATTELTPQDIYDVLMAARRGGSAGQDPVDDTLARIISSWVLGIGAMPAWLGLGEQGFTTMLHRHFPTLEAGVLPVAVAMPDPARLDEMADLRSLLMRNRTDGSAAQAWMADIVVAGCMGDDHLWQDLGLWCRGDLTKLMNDNFAVLAARNDRNMKWKKFLYKQLCETEGIYTCRSPSCEVCPDYQACFGPEE